MVAKMVTVCWLKRTSDSQVTRCREFRPGTPLTEGISAMTWQMIIYISLAAAGISLLGYGGWKAWRQLQKYLARPKKYFMRYLQDAHKDALRSAGVQFEVGTAPDANSGVIVNYEHLPQALAALNATHTASLMLNGKELHEAVLAFPHANAYAHNPEQITVWVDRRDKTIAPRV
jgi:hypothetical protein